MPGAVNQIGALQPLQPSQKGALAVESSKPSGYISNAYKALFSSGKTPSLQQRVDAMTGVIRSLQMTPSTIAEVSAFFKEYPALSIQIGKQLQLVSPKTFETLFPSKTELKQKEQQFIKEVKTMFDRQQRVVSREHAKRSELNNRRQSPARAAALSQPKGYTGENSVRRFSTRGDGNCLFHSLGQQPSHARRALLTSLPRNNRWGSSVSELQHTARSGWSGGAGDVTAEMAIIRTAKEQPVVVLDTTRKQTIVYTPDASSPSGVSRMGLGYTTASGLKSYLSSLGFSPEQSTFVTYSGNHYSRAEYVTPIRTSHDVSSQLDTHLFRLATASA